MLENVLNPSMNVDKYFKLFLSLNKIIHLCFIKILNTDPFEIIFEERLFRDDISQI